MRYTPDAETLANLLEGTWQRLPPNDWTLRHLVSAQQAGKRAKAKPGTLAYASRPSRALSQINGALGAAERTAIITDLDSDLTYIKLPILRVEDLTAALDTLGSEARKYYRGSVVAITGSAGKTTTRAMLRHVLSPRLSVFDATGNYLSRIRTQSLQMTDQDVALFEVARVSLPGAERFLSPDIAVITAITEAHMEHIGSLKDIARAKARLLEGLKGRGTAIINIDSPYSEVLLAKAKSHAGTVTTYGESENADFRLASYDYESGQVTTVHQGEELTYILGATGKHNALNSLSVLAVLNAMRLKVSDYLDDFATFKPVRGRGDVTEITLNNRSVTVVNQAYNANPASMRSALEAFKNTYKDRRRVLVLGDMAELGPSGPALHRELVPDVLSVRPEKVLLVGPLMGEVWKELPHALQAIHSIDAGPVSASLSAYLRDGDAVLVKASNSTGLADIVSTWHSADSQAYQCLRLTISGNVQEVGYRRWVKESAERLSFSGWVRNRSDGKVEALVRGDLANLGHLLRDLHAGPPRAQVSRITSRTVDVRPHPGFRLRRTRYL